MERRFTRQRGSRRIYRIPQYPELASRVISACGSSSSSVRTAVRISSLLYPESRLGVPPPKNTDTTLRPHTQGQCAFQILYQCRDVLRLRPRRFWLHAN